MRFNEGFLSYFQLLFTIWSETLDLSISRALLPPRPLNLYITCFGIRRAPSARVPLGETPRTTKGGNGTDLLLLPIFFPPRKFLDKNPGIARYLDRTSLVLYPDAIRTFILLPRDEACITEKLRNAQS